MFLYSPEESFDIRLRLGLSKANVTAYIETISGFCFHGRQIRRCAPISLTKSCKQKCGSWHILGVRRIFARILLNLPEKNSKKCVLQKNSACDLGRHLFLIKADWAPFLLILSGSLLRFCPGFHQIKTFEGELAPLHPRLLHQCLEEPVIFFPRTNEVNHFDRNVRNFHQT